jgi:deoxyinosine 3'endonuclease (endonuclease V)
MLLQAVRTSAEATNPVYVSVGHKISLETAVKLVLACSLKRVPEPVRQADLLSRKYIRKEKRAHK